MKKSKKILCLFISLLLSLSLVSCDVDFNKQSSTATISNSVSVQDSFDKYLDKLFKESVTSDTITLHYTLKNPAKYNIKNIEPTLGSFTEADLKQHDSDVKNEIKRLKSFDYDSLTKKQQTTYDVINNYLSVEKTCSGLSYYASVLSPTIGLQAQLPVTFAEYSFYDEDDVKSYISLLNLTDDYFSQVIDFEKEKSKKGLFMADFAVDDIVKQCNDFIQNPDSNYLISTFDSRISSLSSISDENKEKYKEENKKAVLESVIPAYKNLITELNSLKGTGKNNGGLCNFDKGKDYYEYLVASNTGSSKSIKEIKSAISGRISLKFNDIRDIVTNSPDIIDAYNNINYSENPSEILDTLKEKIKKYYPIKSNTNYEIKYVDKSLEDNLSPAFFMIPPIDDYENNVIYINNSQVDDSTLFPTLAHEGYPGHLYQVTYFNSTNPEPIRQVLNFGGYSEGWATYVEMQSYELEGLDNKSLVKLSQDQAELALAIPALIDIGVNYYRWTLDDTTKFISDYGYSSQVAENIYNYVIEAPTNYLEYYVGYLEFTELKEYASSKLGNKFNLKSFNKALLDAGPSQFSVVKKYVDAYIQKNK